MVKEDTQFRVTKSRPGNYIYRATYKHSEVYTIECNRMFKTVEEIDTNEMHQYIANVLMELEQKIKRPMHDVSSIFS